MASTDYTVFKLYRDAKGRFAKFVPGKVLRPILLSRATHQQIAFGELKSRSKEYNYTGLIAFDVKGKRVKMGRLGVYIGKKGIVYFTGVPIINVKNFNYLSLDDFEYIMQGFIKGRRKRYSSRVSVIRALAKIYGEYPGIRNLIGILIKKKKSNKNELSKKIKT